MHKILIIFKDLVVKVKPYDFISPEALEILNNPVHTKIYKQGINRLYTENLKELDITFDNKTITLIRYGE